MSYKDKLRTKTLGLQNRPLTDDDVVPITIIEDGEELLFEIHTPTIAVRNKIFKESGIYDDGDNPDGTLVPILGVIYLVHTPRSEGPPERVYTKQDQEDLLNAKAGSYADKLMMAAMKVINLDPQEKAGN